MGMFDIGGGSSNRKWWNHTNKSKDGYCVSITGDVVEIAAVPHYLFGTNTIDRWPDGNPRIDMRITLATPDGDVCFSIKKFSNSAKRDWWPTMQTAMFDALTAAGLPGESLQEFGGLNITMATKEPPQGFGYGAGNPRPYSCVVNGRGTNKFRGCKDEVTEQAAPPQFQVEDGNPGQAKLAETLAAAANAFGYAAPVVEEVSSVYDKDIPF